MAMLPHERSLVTRYKNRPFVLLGVSADHTREAVQKVQKSGDVSWRSWWLEGNAADRVNRDWDVSGYPTIVLIDANGRVQNNWVGRPDDKELEREIDRLVADAEKK
jgi:hypothetical protein